MKAKRYAFTSVVFLLVLAGISFPISCDLPEDQPETTTTTLGPVTYEVSTLSAPAGAGGHLDGALDSALFQNPAGICLDSTGQYLYVADVNNHVIRKIDTYLKTVITYAGIVQTITQEDAETTSSYVDGPGTTAKFKQPYAVGLNSSGELFVADQENHLIRKIDTARNVTTWAGKIGNVASQDGTGDSAYFHYPTGIAVDLENNVYITDYGTSRIRKGTPAQIVTTPAGSTQGDVDGTGAAAKFKGLGTLAVDEDGTVYIVDAGNHKIRKMSPAGEVTTLAGFGYYGSFADGQGTAAKFKNPFGIAVDHEGNVFVADSGNNRIRKITPTGLVTTIAGTGEVGSSDGTGLVATFNSPTGIAVSASGIIYVADCENNTIRKLQPSE